MKTKMLRYSVGARLAALGILCWVGLAEAQGPSWWISRGAVNGTAEDYAIANLGQLKWMATKAKEELDSFVPGGAGTAVNALVDSWSTLQPDGSRVPVVTASTSDYAPANLGQIKAVAKPYWDRLVAQGYATATEYPWTATTSDDEDYAIANLGQLKTLFSISVDQDRDSDGIPDHWEIQFAGSLSPFNGNIDSDADGDGVSDLAEYQFGWNPLLSDMNDMTKAESLTYDNGHRLRGVSGKSALSYTPDESSNLTQAN